MELYENSEQFRDAIVATAEYFKVSPAIIEKDYFVTLILKKLNENIPGILFKGGTSLSKCFKIINRFSEDIDLTLDMNHFTQSNKRKANKTVIAICDDLGFEIENREQVEHHSHGNYNCYNIRYPMSFNDFGVKTYVKLEMVFIQKAYPDTIKSACSMIGEYLISIGQEKILPSYGLDKYEIKVQSIERTFVDKVFALCDYYLQGEVLRQSRHIYDISRLMTVVDWENLNELIESVREERQSNKTCLSAQDGVSVSKILIDIIEAGYYKKDYDEVTSVLLSDGIKYDEAITDIARIAELKIFG